MSRSFQQPFLLRLRAMRRSLFPAFEPGEASSPRFSPSIPNGNRSLPRS